MKRSNFLATIAAIFLAPFGIKAKPKEKEYQIFSTISPKWKVYFNEYRPGMKVNFIRKDRKKWIRESDGKEVKFTFI